MSSKKRAPPAAAAASAPSPAAGPAPKRARHAPASAFPAAAPPRRERVDAQTAAALAASRRVSFGAYHTEVLWAWGQDHDGWSIPRDAIGDRERVLTALSTTAGVIMPSSEEEMRKCWRRVMKAGTRAKFPLLEYQHDEDELDEEDDEREAGAPAPSSTIDSRDDVIRALRRQLEGQRSSAHGNAQPAAAATPAALAPSTHLQQATCSHCFSAQMVSDPSGYRCSTCGLLPHLPYEHERNAYLRTVHARAAASLGSSASSAGQSNTTQTAASPTPHLNKREKEFERLAAERPQLKHFASTAPVSVQDALNMSRESYAGAEYDHTPASLLKLIQSGNLMRVGHALPRTLASANSRTDHADAVFLLQTDGKMTAADSMKPPPLACMRDFTLALFSTILPALVAQPTATADWYALARTVHEMDARHGWPAASAYLDMLLSDRVHRNAPFANYDDRMVSSAMRAHPPASGAAAAQQATGARNPAAPAAVNSTWMDGVCRDYNRSSCHRGAGCSYQHECAWHGCSGADRKHAAFDCPSRPAGFKRNQGSVASSRGGRGGAAGKPRGGGRGGGAGSTVASTAV